MHVTPLFIGLLNHTSTTEIYTDLHTLSLHDALPLCCFQRKNPYPEPRRHRCRHRYVCKPGKALPRISSLPARNLAFILACRHAALTFEGPQLVRLIWPSKIGRASCRERVGQYV